MSFFNAVIKELVHQWTFKCKVKVYPLQSKEIQKPSSSTVQLLSSGPCSMKLLLEFHPSSPPPSPRPEWDARLSYQLAGTNSYLRVEL